MSCETSIFVGDVDQAGSSNRMLSMAALRRRMGVGITTAVVTSTQALQRKLALRFARVVNPRHAEIEVKVQGVIPDATCARNKNSSEYIRQSRLLY